jgi:hypothetical protein
MGSWKLFFHSLWCFYLDFWTIQIDDGMTRDDYQEHTLISFFLLLWEILHNDLILLLYYYTVYFILLYTLSISTLTKHISVIIIIFIVVYHASHKISNIIIYLGSIEFRKLCFIKYIWSHVVTCEHVVNKRL